MLRLTSWLMIGGGVISLAAVWMVESGEPLWLIAGAASSAVTAVVFRSIAMVLDVVLAEREK